MVTLRPDFLKWGLYSHLAVCCWHWQFLLFEYFPRSLTSFMQEIAGGRFRFRADLKLDSESDHSTGVVWTWPVYRTLAIDILSGLHHLYVHRVCST